MLDATADLEVVVTRGSVRRDRPQGQSPPIDDDQVAVRTPRGGSQVAESVEQLPRDGTRAAKLPLTDSTVVIAGKDAAILPTRCDAGDRRRLLDARACQVASGEVGAGQIGVVQRGVSEQGVAEVCPGEVGPRQVRVVEVKTDPPQVVRLPPGAVCQGDGVPSEVARSGALDRDPREPGERRDRSRVVCLVYQQSREIDDLRPEDDGGQQVPRRSVVVAANRPHKGLGDEVLGHGPMAEGDRPRAAAALIGEMA